MNELEERAFKEAFGFYAKWRGTVIETEEQWTEVANDVGAYMIRFSECILAGKLITAVMDALNELYKDGKKPMPAGYFGRDDM